MNSHIIVAIPTGLLLGLLLAEPAAAQHASRAAQKVTFGIQPEHRAIAQTETPVSAAPAGANTLDAVVTVDLHGQQGDKVTIAYQSSVGSSSTSHLLMNEPGAQSGSSTTKIVPLSGVEKTTRQTQAGVHLLAARGPDSEGPWRIVLTITE